MSPKAYQVITIKVTQKDQNLKLKKENSNGSGYLREKHGTSSCLQILHPTTFSFKEEGFLATHPPSYHPWRVFGCPENERKGEKMRETGKEREELKASCPKRNFINEEELSPECLVWGLL